jgi:PPOX class probable F420-dependent enzyme
MAYDLAALPDLFLDSLSEFHVAVLAVTRPDGTPHATVVGFTYDPLERIARVISRAGTRKEVNIGEGAVVALTTHAGRHWMTLEGKAVVTREPDRVKEAVARYEARYFPAAPADDRIAIEVAVSRAYGMYE